ncbi:uncharacterized protein LOC129759530 [Uranotaenia lowii]|uniref:uncharacterized protein LOC129759530 n=1 Tax=Uranotaenia lowii TaxID=190385 RepID=UPI002478CA73|nr:uncharacterized protein LOC129759530 [Uranotaenia lowii]
MEFFEKPEASTFQQADNGSIYVCRSTRQLRLALDWMDVPPRMMLLVSGKINYGGRRKWNSETSNFPNISYPLLDRCPTGEKKMEINKYSKLKTFLHQKRSTLLEAPAPGSDACVVIFERIPNTSVGKTYLFDSPAGDVNKHRYVS